MTDEIKAAIQDTKLDQIAETLDEHGDIIVDCDLLESLIA